MKMITCLLFVALAACGASDVSQIEQHQENDRCNAPFYVKCDPGDVDDCTSRCDGVLSYCPEYTATEIAFCLKYPGYTSCVLDRTQKCSDFSTPCNYHDCLYGAPAAQVDPL